MKKFLILLVAALVLPSVAALNLDVDLVSSNNVMIPELNKPANFELNITNKGEKQEIGIFTPVVSKQKPSKSERLEIDSGESKRIDFVLYPPLKGTSNFEYYIDGEDNTYTGSLNVKNVDIRDIFEVGSSKINPEENSVEIYVENTLNNSFKDLNSRFSSPFFEIERDFSIGPKERKTFEIGLDKEDFDQIRAGFYTLSARIKIKNETVNSVGNIEFESSENIDTSKDKGGILIYREKISKSNEGNVEESVTIRMEKDILSRIFTSFNNDPDIVDRQGSSVYYTWERNLQPGQKIEVESSTNWIFPIVIILFLVFGTVAIKKYFQNDVKIKKKTKFVKSKGEEFALRVDVFVQARRPVENVVIIDRLPPLLKLYKKFGKEKPKNVDEQAKKIEWEFDSLEAGEERVLSYVAYSKVKVVGKFALPKTTSVYEKGEKVKESASNKVYFVSNKNIKQ